MVWEHEHECSILYHDQVLKKVLSLKRILCGDPLFKCSAGWLVKWEDQHKICQCATTSTLTKLFGYLVILVIWLKLFGEEMLTWEMLMLILKVTKNFF